MPWLLEDFDFNTAFAIMFLVAAMGAGWELGEFQIWWQRERQRRDRIKQWRK